MTSDESLFRDLEACKNISLNFRNIVLIPCLQWKEKWFANHEPRLLSWICQAPAVWYQGN